VTFQSVAEELLERCRSLAQGACDITLVFDKGNNSAENLEWVGNSPFHFVGSLVPTQHKDLLRISRKAMRRLDPTQLPAFGPTGPAKWSSESSAPSSAPSNQKLFDFPDADPFPRDRQAQTEITGTQDPPGKSPPRFPRESAHRRGSSEEREGDSARPPHGGSVCCSGTPESRGPAATLFSAFGIRPISICARHYWARPCFSPDRTDWSDEQIVLAYRAQHHVEADFRRLKDPHYLNLPSRFHWNGPEAQGYAFYCVLALLMLNLLRRKLAQAGIPLSIADDGFAYRYSRGDAPLPSGASAPRSLFVRTVLADMDPISANSSRLSAWGAIAARRSYKPHT